MSLDKQRILSELGSVMNQLQSADCGCMGKMFSGPGNPNQNAGGGGGYALPTCGGCRRGTCYGHGYGPVCPSAGEPYSNAAPASAPCVHRHCMGGCNPKLMYADTYNYLNKNLMQPAVQEVYQDLSSITPGNTIKNDPLANQIMPSQQGNAGNPLMQSNAGGMAGQNPMSGAGLGMPAGNAMNTMPPNANQPSGGMGNQILNMMMSSQGSRPATAQQPSMGENQEQYGAGNVGASYMGQGDPNAYQRNVAHGNMERGQENMGMGQESMGMGQGNMGMGQGKPRMHQGNMRMPNDGQANMSMMNPTTQYVTQNQTYSDANAPGNPISGNINPNANPGNQSGFINSNPAAQQRAPANPAYGQHSLGITKFNEMFPGVMQGGDLGFDPMAIALQMNPKNQERSAMDAIQKVMFNKGNLLNNTQAGLAGTNASSADTAQAIPTQQNVNQTNVIPENQLTNQQNIVSSNQVGNQQLMQGQQQVPNPNVGAVAQPNQQVYTAVTGAPMMTQNGLQGQQQLQNEQQLQSQLQPPVQPQQLIDPNTGAPINSPVIPADYENVAQSPNPGVQRYQQELAPQATPQKQQFLQEHILPVDTSKNHQLYYNTLGQPVQLLPRQNYPTPQHGLPQTLYGETPNRYTAQANLGVKNTVSKTSIVGNRSLGKTPSKSQLQHIYRQYKGSQSYTQQNIRAPQDGTYSEGRLNVPPVNTNAPSQIPVERVAGDTSANNQQLTNKVEQVMGQIGDVPAENKPQQDLAVEKGQSEMQPKPRNGLQDKTFGSYANAAWSFHGQNDTTPYSYRYSNKE